MLLRDPVLGTMEQKELAMTHAVIYPFKYLYIFNKE